MSDSNQLARAAQNGRPWYARVISDQWGPLLVLAGAVGAFLYMQHIRDQTQLANQAAERKLHAEQTAAQRKIHTEQVDRLLTLIVTKVIDALENNENAIRQNTAAITAIAPTISKTSESVIAIRSMIIKVRENQKSFVPILERLLKVEVPDLPSETIPPGRNRQALP